MTICNTSNIFSFDDNRTICNFEGKTSFAGALFSSFLLAGQSKFKGHIAGHFHGSIILSEVFFLVSLKSLFLRAENQEISHNFKSVNGPS